MLRTDVINHLIKTYGFERYLEIGVFDFENFDKIDCKYKYWCDPEPRNRDRSLPFTEGEVGGYILTSDRMFELFELEERYKDIKSKFDIIFIDGLHFAEQVKRDLENSIRYLNFNGYIIVHDCNPAIKELATEKWILPEWCGTVWKGYSEWCVSNIHRIDYYTIDTDYGVGVVKNKSVTTEPLYNHKDISWEDFDLYRRDYLNLISKEQFLKGEIKSNNIIV